MQQDNNLVNLRSSAKNLPKLKGTTVCGDSFKVCQDTNQAMYSSNINDINNINNIYIANNIDNISNTNNITYINIHNINNIDNIGDTYHITFILKIDNNHDNDYSNNNIHTTKMLVIPQL